MEEKKVNKEYNPLQKKVEMYGAAAMAIIVIYAAMVILLKNAGLDNIVTLVSFGYWIIIISGVFFYFWGKLKKKW